MNLLEALYHSELLVPKNQPFLYSEEIK